jgi:hypothetical protein
VNGFAGKRIALVDHGLLKGSRSRGAVKPRYAAMSRLSVYTAFVTTAGSRSLGLSERKLSAVLREARR